MVELMLTFVTLELYKHNCTTNFDNIHISTSNFMPELQPTLTNQS